MLTKKNYSIFGPWFRHGNLFVNSTFDSNWGQIPFDIGINSIDDYGAIEATQRYQAEVMNHLCSLIDFRHFSLVGEIGGSPFVQAKTLLNRFPHLEARLTDRHDVYWKSIQRLGIFNNTTFFSFDALVDDYSVFKDCDVLMLWGVDLFYSDTQLIELFRFAKSNRIRIVIGSRSVEHLKKSPKRILRSVPLIHFLVTRFGGSKSGSIKKFTSVYRTSKYFGRLCKLAGVGHVDLGTHSVYRVHIVN
jgi:hypothetical protein